MNDLLRRAGSVTLVLAAGLQTNAGPAPTGDLIERIGSLQTARAVHTTTALASGRLLVAGGMSGGASIATAEIFDMATAAVSSVVPMRHARSGHSATALPDGRVVLAGGYDGNYLASVEAFDPATGTFMDLGQLSEGRSGHTATLLPDGRILMVGGVGRGWSFLASAEIFDPIAGRSRAVEPLSVPRESHTATLLDDGRILVVGGHRGRREAMEVYPTAELYDPRTGRFEPAGRMTTPRHKHDAVRLSDGRVLVLGGADRTDRLHFASTEIYHPATGSFSGGPSMTATRYKIQGTSVLLPDGDVLVPAGGRIAELLDRRSFSFRAVPATGPGAYYFATATALSAGDVVIVGGYGQGVESSKGVWRFRRN